MAVVILIIPLQLKCLCLTSNSFACTVDFDALGGNKIKGINHAIFVVEPHPYNVEETIIMVSTSSGAATIWHSTDPRCYCKRTGMFQLSDLNIV